MIRHTKTLSILGAAAAFLVASTASGKTLHLKGSFKFVSEAPMETITGTAKGATGTIQVDLADLSKTTGTVSVAVKRLVTGSPIRDEHLQGSSWLDGENHPRLTFTIRAVNDVKTSQRGEVFVATGSVHGDFTLKGVTKPLSSTFTLKLKGARAKVELAFQVELAAYDIKGRDGVIGKKVGEKIALRGRLVGSVTE